MFMRTRITIVVAFMLALASFLGASSLASAHGQTTVGDYQLEIGFHNEPALQGQPNSLDLFVTDAKTNQKVNGLEDTLQAEVIYGSSRRTLKIEPQEDLDGAYGAPIIPTALGDYTWHIFGTIQGTPVDVSMTSSPTTFNSVEALSAYAFPAADPTAADLQAQAAASARMAQLALILAVVGVILGAGGLAYGLSGRRARTASAPLGRTA